MALRHSALRHRHAADRPGLHRADALTGLDDDNARYYDPIAGQFTSADTTLAGGLNEYAYVDDNPETRADPTGHAYTCPTGGCEGGGSGGSTGSRRPTTGGSNALPKGCNYLGVSCVIDAVFHNPRTQKVLRQLAQSKSEIALKLLNFLLDAGAMFGGDTYISWTSDPNADAAETLYYSGEIILNTSLLSNNAENGAANGLIHEAVESYYILDWGLDAGETGTQRGDYVAQWFAGEFESQAQNPKFTRANEYAGVDYYKAYGLTFAQWKMTQDYLAFSSEAPSAWNSARNKHLMPPGWAGDQVVGMGFGIQPIRELDEMEPFLYNDPAWIGNPTSPAWV